MYMISKIYRGVRILIEHEYFDALDIVLDTADGYTCSRDYALAMLTATAPVKSKLKYRDKFYKQVRWRIDCIGLLGGLK